MKTNVISILVLGAMIAMTACSSEDDLMDHLPEASKKETNRKSTNIPGASTVLVYMAGRNDLSSDLDQDLEEIKRGSTRIGDNNLIVFVRRFRDNEKPWVARIRNGKVTDSVSVADLGIANPEPMACDPEVMETVMDYAYKRYPAIKDYGLVLWGHGGGWLMQDSIAGTRGFGKDEGAEKSNKGKWVNIPTLAKVLKKMPHMKFIMCDCCNMMCLENLYELRQTADYMIGSTAEIPSDGAPYDEILPDMFAGGNFWKQIVDKYFTAQYNALPLSVVKMNEMINVANATRNVLPSVKASIGESYADMTGMIHYFNMGKIKDGFTPDLNIFYDAGDFIKRYAPAADYQQWKQALDEAVIYKKMSEQWATELTWSRFYSDFHMTAEKYHGVSMFVPQDPTKGKYNKMNTDIKQLTWYSDVGLNTLEQ
jgi:hypothetical protein